MPEPSPKDEVPYGYVKAYNPILLGASVLVLIQMIVFTITTVWMYGDPTMSDRFIQTVNVWTNWLQLAVSFGLWWLTYKLATLSDEPLQKLRKLAAQAETALGYFDILLNVFRPGFEWLKEMYEKGKIRPMTPEDIKKQIEGLQSKLKEMEIKK